MLKELLVLAAIGAVGAPLAIQTQDANALIYGSLQPLDVISAGEKASSIRGYISRLRMLASTNSDG